MRKWQWISAWLVALMTAQSAVAAVPVAPEALAAELQARRVPLLLDVRSEQEFAAGRIPGAVLIPHDQLAARLAELGAPGEVVVYCRSGRRVGLVRDLLESSGFRVRELDGSFNAWQERNLPIEQDVQK